MMKSLLFLVPALGLVAILTLAACSPGPWQPLAGAPGPYQQPYPSGPGGMMGGGGGMMGPGMMGGGGSYNPQATPITLDQAAEAVGRYLNAYGRGLTLKEVMEFTQNFYAEIEEEDTGIHAMELLVDKYSAQVYPEMGPNMMWNTKYGMMAGMMGGYSGGRPTASMSITPEQARTLAQEFLDAYPPGLTVAGADPFYGYYTLHTLRQGQVEGMLSVNGYTGAVWYHTWHGPFLRMKESQGEG